MKKFVFSTVVGLTWAAVCAAMGLAALSATIVTVTVFCAVPISILLALEEFSRRRSQR